MSCSGWSEFMLQALLKQCLGMPIHNSEAEAESEAASHDCYTATVLASLICNLKA